MLTILELFWFFNVRACNILLRCAMHLDGNFEWGEFSDFGRVETFRREKACESKKKDTLGYRIAKIPVVILAIRRAYFYHLSLFSRVMLLEKKSRSWLILCRRSLRAKNTKEKFMQSSLRLSCCLSSSLLPRLFSRMFTRQSDFAIRNNKPQPALPNFYTPAQC